MIQTLPSLLLGRRLIEAGRWDDAQDVLRGAEAEYVPAHDGLRNMNARMQDEIYRRYGRRVGDRVGDAVYDEMTEWTLIGATPRPFRAQVEAIAMLWHWHRTPFRMSEDRDKVTFMMEPCGSGGRMINEGAYDGARPRSLTVLEEASPASFSQPNFPSWCTHCAFSNRAMLRRGLAYFVIEGWTPQRRGGACVTHAYKSLAAVPQSAAARVGVSIDGGEAIAAGEPAFSSAELAELARPAVERIIGAVRRADAQAAMDLIDRSWQAWLGLHHAYRCWYALFDRACRAEFTEPAADELLRASAWELVAPILKQGPSSFEAWLRFWRSHGAAVDVDRSGTKALFTIDQAAIVHPDLAEPERGQFAGRLAEAITVGAAREGYAEDFGVLTATAGKLLHEMPGDPLA